jgi:demethylmenaquinone methyltransferase/2-methoxy-6-polyprenyl-1,4-benzoquinol methylase
MFEIKDTDRVLDLCCGTGTLTLMLKDKTKNLVGVDLSIGQIKQAKKKDNKMKWLVADAAKLPFHSLCFDKCIICFALHEMFKEERKKVLAQVYRVLKDKGKALICEPNMPEKRLNKLAFFLFERLNFEYYTCMDMLKSGLINEIKEAKFKIKTHYTLGYEWLQVVLIEK